MTQNTKTSVFKNMIIDIFQMYAGLWRSSYTDITMENVSAIMWLVKQSNKNVLASM
jgi:hypothetical protein